MPTTEVTLTSVAPARAERRNAQLRSAGVVKLSWMILPTCAQEDSFVKATESRRAGVVYQNVKLPGNDDFGERCRLGRVSEVSDEKVVA